MTPATINATRHRWTSPLALLLYLDTYCAVVTWLTADRFTGSTWKQATDALHIEVWGAILAALCVVGAIGRFLVSRRWLRFALTVQAGFWLIFTGLFIAGAVNHHGGVWAPGFALFVAGLHAWASRV